MNKYNAIKVIYNGITFDSKMEVEVYKTLLDYYPASLINCHKKLLVKPKTIHYPEFYWKCDFQVIRANLPDLFIEAKGIVHRDFRVTLQLLDSHYPEVIDNLIIVSYRARKIDSYFRSISIPELDHQLKQSKLHYA